MSFGGSLFVLPLLLVVIVGVVLFFRTRKNVADKGLSRPNWTPAEAVAITIAAYFITQFVAGLLISAYLFLRHQSPDSVSDTLASSVGVQFSFILAVDLLMAWVVYVFIRRRKTPLTLIGFVKPQLRDVLYVLIGFGAYFVLYTVVLTIMHTVIPGLDVNQKQELGFDTDSGGAALILAFIGLVILPPLVEEFLMRGFLFSGLRTRMKFLPAAVITSVIFASAHLQVGSGRALLWVAAIDTFILSMVLTTLRERSRSLWPGIGLHAVKNSIAFAALFIFHIM